MAGSQLANKHASIKRDYNNYMCKVRNAKAVLSKPTRNICLMQCVFFQR